MVLFRRDEELTVIEPPLPFSMDAITQDQDTLLLEDIFDVPKTIAVVLVRLGRYAVALMEGQELVETKTEGRQMKNRHKAGGSSQRRFERSRERLIRELYDKVCGVSQRIFEPRMHDIDYLFLGGEKHTVNGFKKRCGFIEKFNGKIMSRLINVDEPNSEALKSLSNEIYKSRVRVFKTIR
jgi:peptide chain release factor subunit 1